MTNHREPEVSCVDLITPPIPNLHVLCSKKVSNKLLDYQRAPEILSTVFDGIDWVLILGCFDFSDEGLHPGHLSLLATMKILFDTPTVVGIEPDETIRYAKGMFRPLKTANERALKVAGVTQVDYVVIFPEPISYGARDPRSQKIVTARMKTLLPPLTMVDAGDPSNPYPYSQNWLAKTIGSRRIVYQAIGDERGDLSTTRTNGY